jgi:hypothetical protein
MGRAEGREVRFVVDRDGEEHVVGNSASRFTSSPSIERSIAA